MVSEVWNYFEETENGGKCRICGTVRNRKDKSTSTFWQHLKRVHQIDQSTKNQIDQLRLSVDKGNFEEGPPMVVDKDGSYPPIKAEDFSLFNSLRSLSENVFKDVQSDGLSETNNEADCLTSLGFHINSFLQNDLTPPIKSDTISATALINNISSLDNQNRLSSVSTNKKLKRKNKLKVDDLLQDITGDNCLGNSLFQMRELKKPATEISSSSTSSSISSNSPSAGGSKRNDYINWDEFFMGAALLAAQRSKDPCTQVGAVIANEDNVVVGVGYNGMPIGCSDDELPWGKSSSDPLQTKYPFVCHAEMNAILNKNCESIRGATIYATMFPCNECAKLIVQSRIKRVVHLRDKPEKMPMIAAKQLFSQANIAFDQFVPSRSQIVLNFCPDS